MIKLKILEPNLHRNETTFRPLFFVKDYLRQLGIEFVAENATSYDFVLVGQASIADKKRLLHESVEMGLEKLNSMTGDYIIVDGQDSTSLIGTIDVFRHVYKNKNCKLFLKTSYLKDFDDYKKEWTLGRKYWGYDRPGPNQKQIRYGANYSVPDIDDMKSKMKLAGFNWLSTIQPTWHTKKIYKEHDVWAYFQYPMGKDIFEHGNLQSVHYDNFRQGLHERLETIENRYKVLRMKGGNRVSETEYYSMLVHSKIIVAAFGYGEMAPRDIESAMFQSVLVKNDMSHIQTIPNPYVPFETYIPIKWDWSDFEDRINMLMNEKFEWHKELYTNMKNKFIEENSFEKRIIHWYELLKNIDGVTHE